MNLLATDPHTNRKHVPFQDGLRIQLRSLLVEREDLREEIRQLRASVQIYAEIVRRLESANAA
jgi:hypothetical protein